MNNEYTLRKNKVNHTGNILSEFGKKFNEHYNITRSDDLELYNYERNWYYTHNKKCSWEV